MNCKCNESGKSASDVTEQSKEMNCGSRHMVNCQNCGHTFALIGASCDELGWCTNCPKCKGSFDIDLPNDSNELQDLLGYIRAAEIMFTENGYWEVHFRCGSDTRDPLYTDSHCRKCPKEGCHMHTALMDAEKLLDGEALND